jgi:FixJ family two-component response regulator
MRAASESKASLIGIVDDDWGVRESISSLVRSAGFRAALFSSAEDFLHSEELKDAACLILDVRMPGLTGLDLQTRLAEKAWRLPIIFATGYADHNAQEKALMNGAVAFLCKPFADETLFAAIRLALSLSQ